MSKPFRTAPMEDGIRHEPTPESPSVPGPEPYPLLEGEVTLRREFDEAWRGGYKFAATNREVAGLLAEIDRLRDVASRPSPAEPPVFAWLIERGQPEKQSPTVWWADRERWGLTYMDDWTDDASKAFRFESREAAEEVIARKFTPPASRGGPSARAVEHGFLALRRAIGEPNTARHHDDEERWSALRDPAPLAADDREAINGGRCAAQAETVHGWVQCAKPPFHEDRHVWGDDNRVTPARPFA